LFFCRARSFRCLAIAVPGLFFPGCAEGNRPLAVATGNPAGVYYPLGGAMASHWTADLPGVVVKAEVTAGSVTNLIQVARKESDIGFSQADAVADALGDAERDSDRLPLTPERVFERVRAGSAPEVPAATGSGARPGMPA